MASARSREPLWLPDISAITNGRCPGPTVCLPILTSRMEVNVRLRGPPVRVTIGVRQHVAEDQQTRQAALALVGQSDLGVGNAVLAERLTEVAPGLVRAERVHPIVVSRQPPLDVSHRPDLPQPVLRMLM